ncbi:MAG: sigma-54-dependent transcriptional regulator, partial [Gemmatimonadales bacterium]
VQGGAFDFLIRPVSADLLAFRLRRLQDAARLQREVRELRSRLQAREDHGSFIAESAATRQSLDRARLLAGTAGDVLIVAEDGAGKHALAAQIHALGSEREGPMVAVPCSGEASMTESLLFGRNGDSGLAGQAAGGSLVLESLDEFEGSVLERLAGERNRNGQSFRLIALARQEPEPGRFELPAARRLVDELLQREVQLRPIRERREDIPALLAYFVQRAAQRHGRPVRISPEALAMLTVYSWPGNVRELRQAVDRAASTAGARALEYNDFGLLGPVQGRGSIALKAQVEAFERQVITQVLETAGGSRRDTAKVLGVSLRTLFYKIKRYEIEGRNGAG